jgi:hypothetical protein
MKYEKNIDGKMGWDGERERKKKNKVQNKQTISKAPIGKQKKKENGGTNKHIYTISDMESGGASCYFSSIQYALYLTDEWSI